MDSNNRNNRNGGNKKNNKNLRSVISLIGWALVLTLEFNYILAATSGGRSFTLVPSGLMMLFPRSYTDAVIIRPPADHCNRFPIPLPRKKPAAAALSACPFPADLL